MGINMRIFHCYGVKVEKLDSIPQDKKEKYEENFYSLNFNGSNYETNLPVIFGDCYNEEWEFFGQIIDSSHDFRHKGWDSFEWKISNADENDDIDELCEKYGLDAPSHYVITYYS